MLLDVTRWVELLVLVLILVHGVSPGVVVRCADLAGLRIVDLGVAHCLGWLADVAVGELLEAGSGFP